MSDHKPFKLPARLKVRIFSHPMEARKAVLTSSSLFISMGINLMKELKHLKMNEMALWVSGCNKKAKKYSLNIQRIFRQTRPNF